MKKLLTIFASVCLISCADPALERHITQRQAAIAAMPNGPAKASEQAQLNDAILMQAMLQQQSAAIFAQGMQNAGAIYSRNAYTDPNSFQQMRNNSRGSFGNPIYVKPVGY